MNLTKYDADKPQTPTPWGSLTWLVGAEQGNSALMTLGRVVIARGCQNPRHSHQTCEELLHLLSGRLEHSLGKDLFVMEAGDTICIPAGVFHNAKSIGEVDADMVVAYSSAKRDFQKE